MGLPASHAPAAVRLNGVDAFKAMACLLIIAHHLAFYGPMSDVARAAAPGLMGWLAEYGRMAVQVFLVVGGFLATASLAPQGRALFRDPLRLILRRYRRLIVPLMVAVLITVLAAAAVRPWFVDSSVPAAPTFVQLLAHLFLLQDLVGQEALSAGIWYVAIDFQLFVISVALLTLLPGQRHRYLVLVLGAASLLLFNRNVGLDMSGLYFFGSYALGMLAWWASHSECPKRWMLVAALLGAAALAIDFRGRLLVALLVAMALVWVQPGAGKRWLQARWVLRLGQMSYSIFLIHFAVCLLVNAAVSYFWPTSLLANSLGLAAAFALALLAGWGLYRGVESAAAPWRRMRWPALMRP